MDAFPSGSLGSSATGAAAAAPSASSVFEDALAPFRGLDIAQLYGQYSTVVDFVLFLILFLGVTRISLGRQFQGAPGRWVCIAVSLVLSLGLVVAEKTMGFSIASFGPIAVGLLVLVVGVTLFLSIRHVVGVRAWGAAAIAFVIVYLALQAAVPSFFSWMREHVPFLAAVFAIAMIVALWQGGVLAWQGFSGQSGVRRPEDDRALSRETPAERVHGEELLVHEAESEARVAGNELAEAQRRLEQGNPSMEDLQRCMALLRDSALHETRVAETLDRLRALARRAEGLSKADAVRIRFQINALSDREQRALASVLRFEDEELKVEHGVIAVAQRAEQMVAALRQATELAAVALREGRLPEAHQRVAEALNANRRVVRLVYQLDQMESGLVRLLGREARAERAAADSHRG